MHGVLFYPCTRADAGRPHDSQPHADALRATATQRAIAIAAGAAGLDPDRRGPLWYTCDAADRAGASWPGDRREPGCAKHERDLSCTAKTDGSHARSGDRTGDCGDSDGFRPPISGPWSPRGRDRRRAHQFPTNAWVGALASPAEAGGRQAGASATGVGRDRSLCGDARAVGAGDAVLRRQRACVRACGAWCVACRRWGR